MDLGARFHGWFQPFCLVMRYKGCTPYNCNICEPRTEPRNTDKKPNVCLSLSVTHVSLVVNLEIQAKPKYGIFGSKGGLRRRAAGKFKKGSFSEDWKASKGRLPKAPCLPPTHSTANRRANKRQSNGGAAQRGGIREAAKNRRALRRLDL